MWVSMFFFNEVNRYTSTLLSELPVKFINKLVEFILTISDSIRYDYYVYYGPIMNNQSLVRHYSVLNYL